MKFQWSDEEGFFRAKDAQMAGEALEAIRAKHKGDLTPDAVVTASKAKNTPLHGFFEWDDEKAANEFRKEQARMLIRSIRIVGRDEKSVRAYFSVKTDTGRSYQPREVVMSMDDLRQQVLSEAARLLAQAQERLEDVSGLRKAKTLVRQAHKAVQSQVKAKTATMAA